MYDQNIDVIQESLMDENHEIESSEEFWHRIAKTIVYPDKLHFDLSVKVAKSTLSLLPHEGGRQEKVYDINGRYLYSQFIAGMDDHAAEFYIKTMSSNLRSYFHKTPQNYSSKVLAKLAKKGLFNAHQKSGLTESEIQMTLLSDRPYNFYGHSRIKEHAEDLNISFDESKTQLDQLTEELALEYLGSGALARKQRRSIETIALNTGLVGKNGEDRCTNYAHNDWKERQLATQEWMKNHVVTNGKVKIPLSEIGKTKIKSLSEMICLSLGIQNEAEAQGCEWASIVCTLPAVMHPNPTLGQNNWNGTTPDNAGKEISKKFARVRAVLAKSGISLSGIWTRESHLDATPHVNYLVYFPTGTASIIEMAFRMHFQHSVSSVKFMIGQVDTLADGNKPCKFATYAMKYFMKFFNENPSDEAIDEAAWASTWSLRRHAFIGLPSIQIWRIMRKTTTTINDTYLEQLRQTCRNNDAAGWIRLCGGLNVKRSNRNFKTVIDIATKIVVGVEHKTTGNQFINKTIGEWTIEKA